MSTSKDWREKLREVVAKQKEKAEKEIELKIENEKLMLQYSQILKELQEGNEQRKRLENEISV